MAEEKPITELYKKQISLSEWFENIDHKDTAQLRNEDNEKRERLNVLYDVIGLPFDRPAKFTAKDISGRTPKFRKYLAEHGSELCALRLIPTQEDLPKLRMRGHTVNDVVETWFPNQKIDPCKYRADFVPHPSIHRWSTIFIVNKKGIFGEIIEESHQYLTQGFYTDKKPIVFSFDFKGWDLIPENPKAEDYLKKMIKLIHVEKEDLRKQLAEKLSAKFAHDYLCGYFESVDSEHGTWFLDYNRILGDMYGNFHVVNPGHGSISGHIGHIGSAKGKVKIINDPENAEIDEDEILVCDMTSPDYVHLMKKAKAIVTDRGGILCHAAIIARELNKPCIVGTGNATKILKNGMMIEVDAEKGVVRVI